MRAVSVVVSVLMVLSAAGCERYHRMPLDGAAVASGLSPPSMRELSIRAQEIQHPLLKPVEIDPNRGISPEGAAIIAVLVNPKLRAERDKKGVSEAQLLKARILPNPQLSGNFEIPFSWPTSGQSSPSSGKDRRGSQSQSASASSPAPVNPFGFDLSYDIRSLITRGADVEAARAHSAAVALDVAWQEWQVAEAAKLHAYRQLFLEDQLKLVRKQEQDLRENFEVVQQAVSRHELTLIDSTAARDSLAKAHELVLATEQSLEDERRALNLSLGFPPELRMRLDSDIALPAIPPVQALLEGMEERRLDLLALKLGYSSQEARLRSAILAQFPKITMGANQARDNTDVYTAGFSLTMELPLFDRNQGQIAIERATRQQLFDEYLVRLFEAQSAISTACANLEALDQRIRAAEQALQNQSTMVDTYQRALQEGSADVLSYYRVRNELVVARAARIGLQLQWINQLIALEIASGEILEGGKGLSE